MADDDCQSLKYCDVALKLEEIHGVIKSQLSSGTEIMRSIRASQDSFSERIEKMLEKQDRRIEIMEKKVWYASGGVSAITAGITALFAKIFGGTHG